MKPGAAFKARKRKLKRLYKLQNGLCALCNEPLPLPNTKVPFILSNFKLSVDHIIPRCVARGIKNNLQLTHHGCNMRKANQQVRSVPSN